MERAELEKHMNQALDIVTLGLDLARRRERLSVADYKEQLMELATLSETFPMLVKRFVASELYDIDKRLAEARAADEERGT